MLSCCVVVVLTTSVRAAFDKCSGNYLATKKWCNGSTALHSVKLAISITTSTLHKRFEHDFSDFRNKCKIKNRSEYFKGHLQGLILLPRQFNILRISTTRSNATKLLILIFPDEFRPGTSTMQADESNFVRI
jgi:hypothetical protein